MLPFKAGWFRAGRFPRAWLFIAAGWLAVFAVVTVFRPLMPVDETRYLSVAWEMLVRDTWLLPTLNYEPYSHKPPLLFWLIRASWEVFGVGVTPVRVILSAFIIALFLLTGRLAKALLPDVQGLPERSILLLAALPLFLVYASMIMFDSMLAVFVLAGLLCIWRASQSACFRPWWLLGCAIGFGILAKGPVALVYILPGALLAPVWLTRFPVSRGRWYGSVLLSVLIGAGIALCWAIPAATQGGHAYAQKIFVTQSAGRMVRAFDHQEPFLFYAPVILAFLAPLLAWPALWRGARADFNHLLKTSVPVRFLLCAIVPVVLFFSAISSKQIHYMIPVLPGCAILAALLVPKTPKALWPVVLQALPSVVLLVLYFRGSGGDGIRHVMIGFMPWIAVLHIGLTAGLVILNLRKPVYAVESLAASAFMLIIILHVQLGAGFLPRYDLSPVLSAFEPVRARPVAIAPKYDGEYGYVLRLTHHADVVEEAEIAPWLDAHPGGVVVLRDDRDASVERDYGILYSQPFRFDKRIALIEKKRP